MLANLVFGLFYLSVSWDYEMGYDVVRNTPAFQYYDNSSQIIYLSPKDTNGFNIWGSTYLPLLDNPDLKHCYESPAFPHSIRIDNNIANSTNSTSDLKQINQYTVDITGLSIVSKYDLPKYTNLVALAPYVDDQCARAFANQATTDGARLMVFVDDAKANYSQILYAPSGSGALPYSILTTDVSTAVMIYYQMSRYISNNTIPIPGSHLNSTLERISVEVATPTSTNISKLWVSVLVILAGVLILFVLISITLNLFQLRRRRDLRRRLINGEVNLEMIGVKTLTVPEEVLNKLPIRTYRHGEMHFLNSGCENNNNPKPSPNSAKMPSEGASSDLADAELLHPSDKSHQNIATSSSASTTTTTLANSNSIDIDENNSKSAPLKSHKFTKKLNAKLRLGATTVGNEAAETEIHTYNQLSCPICLDDFEDGITEVRELPCLHIYHMECIDPFLTTRSNLCPLCKTSVLPPGYVPDNLKLTNDAVRRERLFRRMVNRTHEQNVTRPNLITRQQQVIIEQESRPSFWSRLSSRVNSRRSTNDSNSNNTNNSPNQEVRADPNALELGEMSHPTNTSNNNNLSRTDSELVVRQVVPARNTSRRPRANLNNFPLHHHNHEPRDETTGTARRVLRTLFPV